MRSYKRETQGDFVQRLNQEMHHINTVENIIPMPDPDSIVVSEHEYDITRERIERREKTAQKITHLHMTLLNRDFEVAQAFCDAEQDPQVQEMLFDYFSVYQKAVYNMDTLLGDPDIVQSTTEVEANAQIIKKVLGFYPIGHIEVEEADTHLIFRLCDDQDFSQINNLVTRGSNRVENVAGFFSGAAEDGIPFIVVNVAGSNDSDYYLRSTAVHETIHFINDELLRFLDTKLHKRLCTYADTIHDKARLVSTLKKELVEYSVIRFIDEFLACIGSESNHDNRVANIYNPSMYENYFELYKQWFISNCKNIFDDMVVQQIEDNSTLFEGWVRKQDQAKDTKIPVRFDQFGRNEQRILNLIGRIMTIYERSSLSREELSMLIGLEAKQHSDALFDAIDRMASDFDIVYWYKKTVLT